MKLFYKEQLTRMDEVYTNEGLLESIYSGEDNKVFKLCEFAETKIEVILKSNDKVYGVAEIGDEDNGENIDSLHIVLIEDIFDLENFYMSHRGDIGKDISVYNEVYEALSHSQLKIKSF